MRYVPITNRVVLGVAALAPYLMFGAPVSLIVFTLQRDWILAAAAATVTIVTVAVQLPWRVRGATAPGVSVRVMSANLRYGRADADAVVSMAREHADILAVQDLTPEKADLMSAAGVDEAFPFHALRACDGSAGVGIWSRYPISTSDTDDDFWLGLVTAKVRVPNVTAEAAVVTHLSAPWPDPIAGWRTDLHRMAESCRSSPRPMARSWWRATLAPPVTSASPHAAARRLPRCRRAGRRRTDPHASGRYLAAAGVRGRSHPDQGLRCHRRAHADDQGLRPPGPCSRHPTAQLTTSAITVRSPICRETPDSRAAGKRYRSTSWTPLTTSRTTSPSGTYPS
jgi:hypothetical protein